MKDFAPAPAILALALLAACSSGEPASEPTEPTDAAQAAMVEDAVRQSYQREGAEVVEISMARNADGSRFEGPATVRDQAGNELDVYCRFSQGAAGEPSLDCTRATGAEDEPAEVPAS